ncbi:hypothetical protein GF325_05605 [Candidatus Bathyarchaeota archaeon]|nr:hypothetical protein [Candidatus Bathyarchaeota archaeon]
MSDNLKLTITCPSCSKKQVIKVPCSTLDKDGNISTVSIEAACGHRFHVFIDAGGKIRGYQASDIVLISEIVQIDQEISSLLGKENTILGNKHSIKNHYNEHDFLQNLDLFFKNRNYTNMYSRQGNNAAFVIEGKKGKQVISTSVDQIKKKYSVRIKQLENAIIKLQVSTKTGSEEISEEEMASKRQKLVELKKKLQDAFKDLVQPTP